MAKQGPFKSKPERLWSAHGLECAMVRNPLGGCNGYVRLPKTRPGSWYTYDDIPVEAHGGLTYGPDEDGWVGFDTLHLGDVWVGEIVTPESRAADPRLEESAIEILRGDRYKNYAVEWTEAGVAAECERLAERIQVLLAVSLSGDTI